MDEKEIGCLLPLNKAEIRQFYRNQQIYEMKNFSEFAENMLQKGMISGCITIQFSDGNVGYYGIEPGERDDVLAFCQQLCFKRSQNCTKKQEEYSK